MAILEDTQIQSLLQDAINFLKGRQSSTVTQPQLPVEPQAQQNSNKTFQNPIKGNYKNSGDFSPNIATDARHKQGHQGVDLRAPGGTAVYPIADGVVTAVGYDTVDENGNKTNKGGNTVNIEHADNVKTYYAHLGTVSVHKGDKVTKDTVIGTVGNSGNASVTAPHLHFQVWQNGQLKNPGKGYIDVPKYSKFENEQLWLSDEAKQEAAQFNKQKHLSQRFSRRIDQINKLADLYLVRIKNS
jgi:murein DD-endopeptidase MepM/ murein hydrolase activator NlpD